MPVWCDPGGAAAGCARRLGALLEDEFDAHGGDFSEKINSVRSRISGELLNELSEICRLQGRAADSPSFEALSERCERVACDLIVEAAKARPRTGDGSFAYREWLSRHRALTGVVRQIRKNEKHAAVLDVDGHLIELRTRQIIQIEAGERVVLLRHSKHDPSEYYNATRKIDLRPSPLPLSKFVAVGAGACLIGGAGVVVIVLLAIRSMDQRGIQGLWKYFVIGVPCVAIVCLGVGLLLLGTMMGGLMGDFYRAVEQERKAGGEDPWRVL